MELIGKVTSINTSDSMYNLGVYDKEKNGYNLKIKVEDALGIKIGKIYQFDYTIIEGERTSYVINSFKNVDDLDFDTKNSAYREFYPSAPLNAEDSLVEINKYINSIENDVIKGITSHLINKYHDAYFTYPAATKMHHAYVGGLAYHSIGMLKLADGFISNYPYLNKDYIYAGIMLHDIGKTIELTGAVNTEYSIKGQLLGHLVLGALEINNAAIELGYKDSKEVMLLEHMLISHHGMPQFGSAKKPMTAEALVLWYIDTIDSKFRVLGDELEKTDSDTFTDSIGVLDRTKIFKA